MANLVFPQLSSGTLAQYPIRKHRMVRTVKNLLADGSVIAYPDADASRRVWELAYSGLSREDATAIKTHFENCSGRLQNFTFLDPTENLLSSSVEFRQQPWINSSLIEFVAGATAPDGTTNAFTVVNTGSTNQEITQTLPIPSGYNYAFSLYACSNNVDVLQLVRRGAATQSLSNAVLTSQWSRILSSGSLQDSGATFTVAISLAPGQEVCLYGPQLEAQSFPSPYRGTAQKGGVYTNAFWAIDQLGMLAEAPDLFSMFLSIEAMA